MSQRYSMYHKSCDTDMQSDSFHLDPNHDGPYEGWYWESSSDLDGFPFTGVMALYGGGGFNIELGNYLNERRSTPRMMILI